MRKPIDDHFIFFGTPDMFCRYCGKKVRNQGLAKVFHVARCKGGVINPAEANRES